MNKKRVRPAARLLHILMWLWCGLVIPTVFVWESTRWLVFMAFLGFAIVMLTCQNIMGVIMSAVAEEDSDDP